MVILLNSHAGNVSAGADLRLQIQGAFRTGGVEAEIVNVESGEMMTAAKQAVEGPGDTIVAGGGDGTISTVAAALADTGKKLGVLPLGTLNHFARDLEIPTDLPGSVRTIIDGHFATIDVGEVNGCVFINNSGLGIYPHVVRRRETEQKRKGLGKWPAFGWAMVNAFRRFPFLDLRIEVEGKTLRRTTSFLFVGNNEYQMAGFQIGARNRLDAGRLSLYLAHRLGRWGLIRLGIRAVLGHLDQAKDFESYIVEEAFIEARHHSVLVAMDGEVQRLKTPLYYRSRPGALRVLVPPNNRI